MTDYFDQLFLDSIEYELRKFQYILLVVAVFGCENRLNSVDGFIFYFSSANEINEKRKITKKKG